MSRRRDDDDSDLSALRSVAIAVFIALSALIVVVDVLGRAFGNGALRPDPVVAGLVFGTLLSLLGLEGIQRLIDK